MLEVRDMGSAGMASVEVVKISSIDMVVLLAVVVEQI